MADHTMGLMGRKLGTTQVYDSNNNVVPVTVVEVGPNTVLAVKTTDGKDGYCAVKLGYGARRKSRTTRPVAGEFRKLGVEPSRFVREFRLPDAEAARFQPGQRIGVGDVFAESDPVDVIGTSKGRGFAGVVRRHHMAGSVRTHGSHEYFRHVGAIGTRLTPGMVLKGKRMPGHMGHRRVTVQNLSVVRLDAERGLLFVKGAVPGPTGGLLLVRKAVKTG